MEIGNFYSTKDLYIASFLYAKGIKLSSINKQGKICWFIFEDKTLCEQLIQRYFAKTESVIAKDLSDAIRTLKDLLFQN